MNHVHIDWSNYSPSGELLVKYLASYYYPDKVCSEEMWSDKYIVQKHYLTKYVVKEWYLLIFVN